MEKSKSVRKIEICSALWAILLLTSAIACEKVFALNPTKDHELLDEYLRSHQNGPMTKTYSQAINAMDYGKHRTAMKLFLQLTQADPKWPGFWTSLATCCMWTEEFPKGLEYATRALALRPKDPDMYNRRAMLLAALMKNNEAIADLTKGLKFDPTDKDLLKRRAECYKAIKKFPEAIADTERLLKLYPTEETIYYVQAESYEATQNWKGAINSYSNLLKHFPEDDHVLVKRATCKMKASDFKGAIVDYSNALKQGTEGPEFVYSQRAIAYEKLGMADKAARDRKSAKAEKQLP